MSGVPLADPRFGIDCSSHNTVIVCRDLMGQGDAGGSSNTIVTAAIPEQFVLVADSTEFYPRAALEEKRKDRIPFYRGLKKLRHACRKK